jgi:hypothetical protein
VSHGVVEALAASVGSRVGLATLEETDPIVATPITYNVFSKWAMPLNSRLRAIRDGIQAALRRHATLGGGRKDFAHAFRKLASSQRADGVLGPKELRELLGAVGRTLSAPDLAALLDFFDADGSGQLDLLEVLSATLSGRPEDLASMIALAAAEDAPDDPYAGGPVGAGKAEIKASPSSATGNTVRRIVKYTLT